ncbi:MAG: phosphate/phosphite/phosphonate ABC transporter substrate-binding protein [Polyangiaceae bacterium]|nr:phosphate/phosphite/phosphonate ABC transporter substrate-binding protein [Polyangiaceae bacterium]
MLGLTDWGFAIIRSHAVAAMRERVDRLGKKMSEKVGASFHASFPGTYQEISRGIERSEIGVAWVPPIVASSLEADGLVSLVAVPVRSAESYQSVLIVRRGGQKNLADLRGRRVAWVDPLSASGYVVPRIYLAANGYDPRTYFVQESFEKTHIAVVDAVANGRVEIGATFQNVHPKTGEVTTAGWTESSGSRVRPVEVVAVAGEIPTDGFVVSKKVDAATRLSIARWFLTPDESAKTLLQELVGASEFRIPSESHFEPLRELLRVARVRGFAIEAPGRLV